MNFFADFGMRLLLCVLGSFSVVAPRALAATSLTEELGLHSRWQNWDGDLEAVRTEFQQINQRSQEIEESLDRDLMTEDRAFLQWWFSRPESRSQRPFLEELLKNSETHFAEKVARASLKEKDWQNAEWVLSLLRFPEAGESILEALISPQLRDDEVLNQKFLNTPEFNENLYWTYFRRFLPEPDSVRYGERVRSILARHLYAEYGPYFFLQFGGSGDHWIRKQPQVIEFALRNIRSPSLMREVVIQKLLTQPAAAQHPEWLEFVLRSSSAYSDFVDLDLNRVLGLSHWIQHPLLLEILQGHPLRAENLRLASWTSLKNWSCQGLLQRN